MPKEKKKSTVIHPNSRKAMQLARMEHRGIRLIKKKGEALTKLKGKMNKLRWFRDNIDTSKTLYTIEDVHELIQKYLKRFCEEEEKTKEVENIKGRHIQNRISHEYKIKFSVEQEKQDYETCGIGIDSFPDINYIFISTFFEIV
ncbi:uncharacterized protein TNIN_433301 [Trichonephila inaurata madagascariensis]|uniref:Translation machinery-associated protein 16 n=1 Tax=Trichonephila inaurata madagascariensis TaxID=2747483 RepID=A0A8X7BVL4_9ARAC|nr:uncharacterized protein TNIN_433301 [Trichonephila inaurata madagascariensis]